MTITTETDENAEERRRGPPVKGPGSKFVRRLLLMLALFAAILIPFLLFDEAITAGLTSAFETARERPWLSASLIVGLLAGDCVLPVPSSLVSTAAGAVFGWTAGAALIWLGMTLGCLAAYGLGVSAGRVLAVRVVGETDLDRARKMFSDLGPAVLVITRGMPVLAEASAIAAGAARAPFWPFMAWTSLANAGVAAAYGAAGAYAASTGSFLLAFLGVAAVPALAWSAWKIRAARRLSKSQGPA